MGRALVAATAAALLLGLTALPAPAASAGGSGFKLRPAPIHDGRLFDLGVTDQDRDGTFEIFSTNHKFQGTLIEGGPGSWSDLMGPTGFSPTPLYPGFEDLLSPPEIASPGLYVYAESRTKNEADDAEDAPLLHVVAHRVEGIPLLPEEARGLIRLPSPNVRVVRHDGASVAIRREDGRTAIRFRVAEQGHIVLRVRKVDLPPIEFQIDQAPLLAQTFIGARRVRAASNTFTLRLIDRHGIAWVDTNSNGRTDAFIVRGGLGGGIVRFPDLLQDELLRTNPLTGLFENRIEGSGLRKGNCRAWQTAAVDYDRDGRLDLFSSCKGSAPKLWRALAAGGYRLVSKPLRRVGARGSSYRWVDLDGDGRPELVVASKGVIKVLRSTSAKRWRVAERIRSLNRSLLVYAIAVGDFNRDGRPDLLAGSKSGNTLLVNRRGRLRAIDPQRLGLPRRGTGASWVDYDNDGRLDLHSIPGGLYRQMPNGRFRRTGLLRGPFNSLWGISNWFDADGNGYRDVLTAIRTTNRNPRVETRLRLNTRRRHNWLQLDLRGRPGNREAIGARVGVRAGGRRQTSWVGAADGSRYSQGHYRVYFGLGKATRAKRLSVRWPGGGRTTLRSVRANQRLVVRPDS